MTGRSKSRSVRRQRSQQRTQRRSQRGGSWGAYPDSAWGFQMNNLGNGWTQFMNSLSVQPGQNTGTSQSNNIVPNNAQDTTKMMAGGKKHRHKRYKKMRHMQQMQMQQQQQQMQQSKSQSRGKKGGYWGAVLEQAAVPLALLGMQQAYGKSHSSRTGSAHKKTFKRRR